MPSIKPNQTKPIRVTRHIKPAKDRPSTLVRAPYMPMGLLKERQVTESYCKLRRDSYLDDANSKDPGPMVADN